MSISALVGTTLLGSHMQPAMALATAALAIAVTLDHRKKIHPDGIADESGGTGRNEKVDTAILSLQRFLCVVPLLPAIFWAGSPFSRDALAIYGSVLGSFNVESVSFTLIIACLLASFLSTLEFPKPLSSKSIRLTGFAEVSLVGVLILAGVASSALWTGSLPVPSLSLRMKGLLR